jgi:hypothetical protein
MQQRFTTLREIHLGAQVEVEVIVLAIGPVTTHGPLLRVWIKVYPQFTPTG